MRTLAGRGKMIGSLRAMVMVVSLSACWFAYADVPGPGKQVYDRWCLSCHGPGPRAPGTSSLAAKYGGREPALLEERTDLTPDLVRFFVRHGVSVMPPFRKTEITDVELNALADYLSHPPAGRSAAQ